jgi:prepilin-type N-terminal cleavage/methylation domain-containing protein
MNKKILASKGFTLIELLVVIAIIGLLSTLSVVALNNAREKARNARRVADIKQVQTALELYYNDNNTYPAEIDIDFNAGGSIENGSTTYMAIVPSNPMPRTEGTACSDSNYIYELIDTNSYSIYYCLSEITGGIPAGIRHATPSGIDAD